MKHLKLFESFEDEAMAEKTWKIDPYDLRDIVQACLMDCEMFSSSFDIVLGMNSIVKVKRHNGEYYDHEEFDPIFDILPERLFRREGIIKGGGTPCIDMYFSGLDEDDDEKIISLKDSIAERLSDYGLSFDVIGPDFVQSDGACIVIKIK
jgi:hypothetical protein